MIFNINRLSSAILILFGLLTLLLVLTWIARPKTMPDNIIVNEITQQEKDSSSQIEKIKHLEPTLPKLTLEGTLLSNNKNSKALLKVNNEMARWYQSGEELQTGLSITKIESNRILIKQGMAYYEFYLIDQ